MCSTYKQPISQSINKKLCIKIMGNNCSCISDGFLVDKEPELFKRAYKRVSSTEATLNSVIKIQSLWRGYKSRKNHSIYQLPHLQTLKAKIRESQIPEYKFPALPWRGKPKAYCVRMLNKDFYKGEWLGKMRHGQGVVMKLKGDKYIGYHKENLMHGHGRYIYANGDIYEGCYEKDLCSGIGSLHCINGYKYTGSWDKDMYNGKGQEFWPDGTLFIGHYISGKKSGYGEFFWNDRSCYKGDFFDNFIHGQGCYMWDDGRKYTGQWKFNTMHGQGCFEWPDGTKFIGEFANDCKQGEGSVIFSTTSKENITNKDKKPELQDKITHNKSFIT